MTAVLAAVQDEFAEQHGPGDGGGFAAVVLDDLASREAAPGAELHLLFVHEGGQQDHYDSLCRRILEATDGLSVDSLLFGPIPAARNRCDVWSLAGFVGHFREGATTDELRDLIRARCVYESPGSGLERRFAEARSEALSGSRGREELITELAEPATDAGEASLSAIDGGRGGLGDVERVARWLQLLHFRDMPADTATTAASVFETAATHGWIADGAAKRLAEAANLWRNLQGAVRLVAGANAEIDALGTRAKAVLAQCCGADDFEVLATTVTDMAASTAAEIDALHGSDASESQA